MGEGEEQAPMGSEFGSGSGFESQYLDSQTQTSDLFPSRGEEAEGPTRGVSAFSTDLWLSGSWLA